MKINSILKIVIHPCYMSGQSARKKDTSHYLGEYMSSVA